MYLGFLVTLQEQKIEMSDNKKMRFMLDNDLFSMESKSDVIISQINELEIQLYNLNTEFTFKKNRLIF